MPFFSFWFQCRTVQSPQFQETRTFQIQVKSTDLDTKSHLNVIKATTRKAWLPKCVFLGDGPCCLSNVQVSNLCSSWDNFWVLVLFCLLDSADPHSKIHMLRAHRFSDINLWHLERITCQKNSGGFVFVDVWKQNYHLTDVVPVQLAFCRRKFTLVIFQQSARNVWPKFAPKK